MEWHEIVHLLVNFPVLLCGRIIHVLQHLSAMVQLYDIWGVHYLSAIRHLALSYGGHINRNLNCHTVKDMSRYMQFPISIHHQSNKLGDGYLPCVQYALIPLAWPRSVTNSAFCWPHLSTVPTAGHVPSAHAHT